ncbi:hypothetical protein HYPSUDRAFT_68105 [Hypholoma sublateritium FD-334 SS-4]|uniref:Uncharacterized protein n=1 Tax=Hypholoma sublateritium (strain FD-334 SS-4) TaxID=945553 RepID=A0A0D2NQ97_HYPSF|nr:hypothetical protein HYPSUDRAFT_68105 [Hypholoma sublateritium FD-334 SS-4]
MRLSPRPRPTFAPRRTRLHPCASSSTPIAHRVLSQRRRRPSRPQLPPLSLHIAPLLDIAPLGSTV